MAGRTRVGRFSAGYFACETEIKHDRIRSKKSAKNGKMEKNKTVNIDRQTLAAMIRDDSQNMNKREKIQQQQQ